VSGNARVDAVSTIAADKHGPQETGLAAGYAVQVPHDLTEREPGGGLRAQS